MIAVLDALDVPRAHVYGTSMGGRVAQWVAVDHPDRVAALVLGCTSPGGEQGLVAHPDVLRALVDDSEQRVLLDLMFTPRWLRSHPGPHHVLGDPAMTPAARRGHRRASAQHDAWEQLPRITAPTLVLHGSDDAFCPPGNADLLAERIPDAEVVVLDGARHAYFEEFRARAGAEVIGFLHRHPLRTT